MVKSNTTSRDMRSLQRDLRKTNSELVNTKQKANTCKKLVYTRRVKAIVTFLCMYKKKKNLEQENNILRKSLKNFNASCNKQKMFMCKQARVIKMLQKESKELRLLKQGLRSIQHKRNPHLNWTACI